MGVIVALIKITRSEGSLSDVDMIISVVYNV